MNAIAARGLGYAYGRTIALHDIDLDVAEGTTFALVGPNGGGKSTLLSLLSTARRPSAGTLSLLGCALPREREKVRRHLATVFQSPALDGFLSARENLALHARLFACAPTAVDDAIARLDLADIADRRVHQLSGGQKRRVELAKVWVQKPKLLLLDEPSTGLDPTVKQTFWSQLTEYQRQHGTTIVVATHDDFEVSLSNDLAFIVHGRLTHRAGTAALMERYRKPVVEVVRYPTLSEVFAQVTGEALTGPS